MYVVKFNPFLDSTEHISYKLTLFGVFLLFRSYFKKRKVFSVSDVIIRKFE